MNPAFLLDTIEYLLVVLFLLWIGNETQRRVVSSGKDILEGLRASLFDMAALKRISFTDPAYQQLHDFLDRSILLSHLITFSALLITMRETEAARPNRDRLLDAIEQIQDPEVRKDLRSIYDQAQEVIVEFFLKRSMFEQMLVFVYFRVSWNMKFLDKLQRIRASVTEFILSGIQPAHA